MLNIIVPGQELFDDTTNEFINTKSVELVLEHSLLSLKKWEAKWKKPFLTKENKTDEETRDYIRAMTITQNVPDDVYSRLTQNTIDLVIKYIDDPMTATTFRSVGQSNNREIVTAEIIYYWMVTFQIPFECQKWHLNQLLTLIKVCNIKNTPPGKNRRNRNDILNEYRKLNEERRAKLNTRG